MTEVSQIADGIFRIDVGRIKTTVPDGFLRYCLVYLIVSNGHTAIIDTSPAAVAPAVLEAINELGYDSQKLSYIILTHIHLDHAGGAGTLAKQLPQTKIVVHQRGASHLMKPNKLIEGTRQAYGEEFETEYGPIIPVDENQVLAVDDGDVIRLGERELKIIYTPGHAPHHICIYDPKTEGIFSGDALGFMGETQSPIIIVAGFDLVLALESIDKISLFHPKQIYVAHGKFERDPVEFINSTRSITKDYGDIILKAIREGSDKNEIIKRLTIYHREHNPSAPEISSDRFESIIPWYEAHFKRESMI